MGGNTKQKFWACSYVEMTRVHVHARLRIPSTTAACYKEKGPRPN